MQQSCSGQSKRKKARFVENIATASRFHAIVELFLSQVFDLAVMGMNQFLIRFFLRPCCARPEKPEINTFLPFVQPFFMDMYEHLHCQFDEFLDYYSISVGPIRFFESLKGS
jgi:hypothetical protein